MEGSVDESRGALGNQREDDSSIVLGVCAMAKKANSKPMQQVLSIIESTGGFSIVIFDEKVILESPIEDWPICDVLISFFSEGFPLDKAESYVGLRKPHCINDLTAQRILLDRSKVYDMLAANDIPHPKAVLVERDATGQLLGAAAENFIEGDDFLKIGDKKIAKPFVEKPMNAEDHNVCIYYQSSAGGGRKRLFRKVDNRSSDFDPVVSSVRRDGSYLYEAFMQTQGTDIKVYTVGPHYAHAEARKSPAIDGVVLRNNDGKEIRYPVVLTPAEKEIARKICIAFQQFVCGFDLLRTKDGSFVIDVNGWSFVKSVPKYYQDCASVLAGHMQHLFGRHTIPHGVVNLSRPSSSESKGGSSMVTPKKKPTDRWAQQELLAVLAVMRHGDRTPKNKTKLVTSRAGFLDLHRRWADGPSKEAKLKSPKQLQEVLDLTNALLGRGGKLDVRLPSKSNSSDTDGEREHDDRKEDGGKENNGRTAPATSLDESEQEACLLIAAVLAEGGHFGGIYRKVQMKPIKWDANGAVEELMLILKYGGILTPAGITQAQALGSRFRSEMYPGEQESSMSFTSNDCPHSYGLLRLHATQRHDFKVYSSDEGRVQMSAAAFVQGLLALEKGALTPICTALVTTDSKMLDELPSQAEQQLKKAKHHLHERIKEASSESPLEMEECQCPSSSSSPMSVTEALKTLQERVADVVKDLEKYFAVTAESVPCGTAVDPERSGKTPLCCSTSKGMLICSRWKKLNDELWKAKTKDWDISKVPEIFDAVKFDLIHHPHLVPSFSALYDIAKLLNDIIVPNEYGYDVPSRMEIGSMVCGPLLTALVRDLKVSKDSDKVLEKKAESKIVYAFQYMKRWLAGEKKPTTPSAPLVSNESPQPQEEKEDGEHACRFAGLDAAQAVGLESPDRRVRTRLYFTSESHIQALMNVLRYCHHPLPDSLRPGCPGEDFTQRSGSPPCASSPTASATLSSYPSRASPDPERRTSVSSSSSTTRTRPTMTSDISPPHVHSPRRGKGIVQDTVEADMRAEPVFDYFTQIVFRLYEDKRVEPGCDERYRVEVLFSPGARGHPSSANANGHIMQVDDLRPLHAPSEPLTLARLLQLLGPMLPPSGIARREGSTGGQPQDPDSPKCKTQSDLAKQPDSPK